MLVEPITALRPQADAIVAVQPKTKAAEPPKPSGSGLPPETKEEGRVDTELLQDVLEVAEKYFHSRNIGLEFSVHDATGRIQVTVFDKDTGDMIREVPPDQVLDLMVKIDEMLGVVFDQKA